MTAPAVTPTPTPESVQPPSSPTPPSTPRTPPTPEVWRAGPNAPAWAAGKTGEELLGITQQLAQVVEQQNRNAPANVQPANQLYAQMQDQGPTFADDDYLTGKQVKQFAQQIQKQQNPLIDQLTQMTASTSLGLIQQKYGDQFKRYGPEIHATLTQIPRTAWTVDNLEQVVSLVRSRHIDEEIQDRVNAERNRLLNDIPPTMRPNGGAGSATQSSIPGQPSIRDESLPAAWRSRAEQVGLTDSDVLDFCRANGQTPEQFFAQFKAPLGVVVEDVSVNQPRSV